MNVKTRKWMGGAVLAIGVFFLMYGAYRGEVETVLTTAVRICLECVGIG